MCYMNMIWFLQMPILAGIGYYSFDWLRTNLKSDEPKEKRQPRIWDLYDPQGHHEVTYLQFD